MIKSDAYGVLTFMSQTYRCEVKGAEICRGS